MATQIGLIPNILKDDLASDLFGTLEQIAETGLAGVERPINVLEIDQTILPELKQRTEAMGLAIIAGGASRFPLAENLETFIQTNRTLGVTRMVQYWGPAEEESALREEAKHLEEIGRSLREAGMDFCYHNHNHELADFGGRNGLELLLHETSPEHFKLEVDLGWVQFAGVDPVAFLRQHGDRVPLVHLRDTLDLSVRGAWTSIGDGVLDVKSHIAAAEEAGVEWVILELKPRDGEPPMDAVRRSVDNLRSMGVL